MLARALGVGSSTGEFVGRQPDQHPGRSRQVVETFAHDGADDFEVEALVVVHGDVRKPTIRFNRKAASTSISPAASSRSNASRLSCGTPNRFTRTFNRTSSTVDRAFARDSLEDAAAFLVEPGISSASEVFEHVARGCIGFAYALLEHRKTRRLRLKLSAQRVRPRTSVDRILRY